MHNYLPRARHAYAGGLRYAAIFENLALRLRYHNCRKWGMGNFMEFSILRTPWTMFVFGEQIWIRCSFGKVGLKKETKMPILMGSLCCVYGDRITLKIKAASTAWSRVLPQEGLSKICGPSSGTTCSLIQSQLKSMDRLPLSSVGLG